MSVCRVCNSGFCGVDTSRERGREGEVMGRSSNEWVNNIPALDRKDYSCAVIYIWFETVMG